MLRITLEITETPAAIRENDDSYNSILKIEWQFKNNKEVFQRSSHLTVTYFAAACESMSADTSRNIHRKFLSLAANCSRKRRQLSYGLIGRVDYNYLHYLPITCTHRLMIVNSPELNHPSGLPKVDLKS